jgi:hypothetical protein
MKLRRPVDIHIDTVSSLSGLFARLVGASLSRLHQLAFFSFDIFLGFTTLLAIGWIASLALGIWNAEGVPISYLLNHLYRVFPRLRDSIWFEPYLPPALISLALVMIGISWALAATAFGRQARQAEIQSIRIWFWLGLPAVFGVLITSVVMSSWSGNATRLDVSYMNIAGFVPNSDARGYLAEALGLITSGSYADFGARRPIATVLRAWTLFVAGYSYVWLVLLQIALTSISIYLATSSVMRWRGVPAALVFFTFAYIIVRPFVVSTMTETLGVLIAFLAVPLAIKGVQRDSNPHLLLAFALFVVGMFVRMGSFLSLPAFVLWAAIFAARQTGPRLKYAAMSLAIVLGAIATNTVLNKIYSTAGGSSVDTAFPFLLCGLSLGSNYHICEVQYAEKLRALTSEARLAEFLYGVAWQNILAQPQVIIQTVWSTGRSFIDTAPLLLFRGYTPWRYDTYFPVWLLYGTSFVGWAFVCRRAIGLRLSALVVFFAASTIASASVVYISDGWRVLIISYPFVAMLIAGGLCTPLSVRAVSFSRSWRARSIAVMLMVCGAVLAFGPWLLRAVPSATEAFSSRNWEVERIIRRQTSPIGFLVISNDDERRYSVPTVTRENFEKFLRAGGFLEQHMEGMPSTPFGFIYAPDVRPRVRNYATFLVPENVMRDQEPRAWRLRLVPFNRIEAWYRAVEVEAVY